MNPVDTAASAPTILGHVVTAEQILDASAKLFSELLFQRLIPLIALVAMVGLMVWVLFQAQKDKDFDASQIIRNEQGRLAWGAIAAIGCWVTHTWTVFARTVNDKITFEEIAFYGVLWCGSAAGMKYMDVWRGVKLGVMPVDITPPPSTPPATPPTGPP